MKMMDTQYSKLDDNEIITRIRQNDDEAMEYMLKKYGYLVKREVRTVYLIGAEAEDLTQEVFLKLLQSHKLFRNEEHLKAWLIRVTINLCRNHARDRKRETLAAEIETPQTPQYSTVLDAVKALPENQRNAIYLHYYEGYTAEEIGKILDAKQNTVLSWLRRGRDTLHDTIGGFDDEI